MTESNVLRYVERLGGSCIIYEGAVLAVRRFPSLPQPPAVSDLVWKIRSKTLRFWVGSAVCGYLLWHFLEGDAVPAFGAAPPTLSPEARAHLASEDRPRWNRRPELAFPRAPETRA